MVLSHEDNDDGEPHSYWYARVVGIFHAEVRHTGPLSKSTETQRMDFLFVRWFGRDLSHRAGWNAQCLYRVSFLDSNLPSAFGFLDLNEIIRAVHMIPAFAHKRTDALLPSTSIAHPHTSLGDKSTTEWRFYYIRMFVDRDMFMRFRGGGVGHRSTKDASDNMLADSHQVPVEEELEEGFERGGNTDGTQDEDLADDWQDEEIDYGYVLDEEVEEEVVMEDEGHINEVNGIPEVSVLTEGGTAIQSQSSPPGEASDSRTVTHHEVANELETDTDMSKFDPSRANSQSLDDDSRRNIAKKKLSEEINTYQHLFSDLKRTFRYPTLVFRDQPKSAEDPSPRLTFTHQQRIANAEFIAVQDKLLQLKALVISMDDSDRLDTATNVVRQSLLGDIGAYERFLEGYIDEQWHTLKVGLGIIPPLAKEVLHTYDSASLFSFNFEDTSAPVLLSILIVLIMYLMTGLSRSRSNFLLHALQMVVVATCGYLAALGIQSPVIQMLSDWWPLDIRTIFTTLRLDPDVVHYACCKKCFALYPPLLSRPGIEDVLISHPCYDPSNLSRVERDIWDGRGLGELKGPDGKKSFFDAPNGEARLAFSLFVDWFNPYGNRASSASVSVGAIYMACLNLPPHLRYRTENIYLIGVIPGPTEPSKFQINHLLAPLIDELLRLWNPGVYITQTTSHSGGRLVRCALIPLVCDLPALRKVAGFMGHSATYFCSFCRITSHEIHNLDYKSWPRRSWWEHLRIAETWHTAPTEKLQDHIYKTHHIRWSPLLRLPYWDVTKFSLLDSMHNLFLGELKRHCVDIWQISTKVDSHPASRKKPPYHTSDEQAIQLSKATNALESSSVNGLKALHHGYLLGLARFNGVPLPEERPVKAVLIDALIRWRRNNPEISVRTPSPHETNVRDFANPNAADQTYVLDKTTLQEIWSDISNTVLPSWIGRALKNFGKPGQGRLKADQWRTACTVHLPITLIRVWSAGNVKQNELLHNFLDLIIGVQWATMRSTSQNHRQIVQTHFRRYLTDVTRLFGKKVLVPNHHESLHLVECLELFGPRFNSNHRTDEMEFTFFPTFCRAVNLRVLVESTGMASAFGAFQKLFERVFGSDFRGTLMNDMVSSLPLEPDPSIDDTAALDDIGGPLKNLDDACYHVLIERLNMDLGRVSFRAYNSDKPSDASPTQYRVQFCSKLEIRGVGFTTASYSKGDSMAFKRLSGEEAEKDPYRKFVYLDAELYRDELEEQVAVVKPSDISSSAAGSAFPLSSKTDVVAKSEDPALLPPMEVVEVAAADGGGGGACACACHSCCHLAYTGCA
ncbi:hypothetical protein EW146_g2479 [Bondarzewia mesenterica]|uniref:Uncharacterized protein n=1 Tax=Bondarzewia mesenterica TaxID=1095465 RepID=A0A4S4M2E9_9AGAM|nr:hypothetical protein EW146_g2479 [Bondarzewia mesenterica]